MMKKKARLYYKLIATAIRSQMQHRASFFLLTFAQILSAATELIGIWVLFYRFKIVQGWTLAELALLYGLVHMGFSFAEGLGRAFDKFSLLIKHGGFDRLMLRPLGTLFQVATKEVCPEKIGRFIQGFVVLLWGAHQLNFSFFSLNSLCLVFAFAGTVSLFYAIFVIQATLAFWLTDTLELLNIITYGGRDVAQFPLTIFNRGFYILFTYLVPIACVIYYPVATLLQRETFPLWIGFLFPFAGFIFLYLSFQFWKLGVKHYHSTGS